MVNYVNDNNKVRGDEDGYLSVVSNIDWKLRTMKDTGRQSIWSYMYVQEVHVCVPIENVLETFVWGWKINEWFMILKIEDAIFAHEKKCV